MLRCLHASSHTPVAVTRFRIDLLSRLPPPSQFKPRPPSPPPAYCTHQSAQSSWTLSPVLEETKAPGTPHPGMLCSVATSPGQHSPHYLLLDPDRDVCVAGFRGKI